ncbi:MAG: 3-phosphoshikimate 1-carboxyvinyltransferase [Desulfobacteraceae bacterium]|nr:3-phosphoshikimate 1-carboxyvinyltransferase [Desulfobacteraceae bacterium]
MIELTPGKIRNTSVGVPGSKSYTHRTIIGAALSDGICRIENPLDSDDTRLTLSALGKMGAGIDIQKNNLVIQGLNGRLQPCTDVIYLGNSGTSMRLLTGVSILGTGRYRFSGTDRMHERPVGALLDSLNQMGISARSTGDNGCPPVEITAGEPKSLKVSMDCSTSSQYLSSLLLAAPCTSTGLEITVDKGPVSKPYIDMTLRILNQFGVEAARDGYTRYKIAGGQTYRAGTYRVESDCSQAGYFWAAAAVSGARIQVADTRMDTVQGDVGLVNVFERMGCRVAHESGGIAVTGGRLNGVTVDMGDMPDMVPTLAVVAAFADGRTVIRNVSHLKVKECDRLGSVVRELGKMGISAVSGENDLIIDGGRPHGALIETYEDHRMAMSFAVAGLMVPGVKIKDETCVEKSFPDFWNVLEQLHD